MIPSFMHIARAMTLILLFLMPACGNSGNGNSGSNQSTTDSSSDELRLAVLSPGMAVMIQDLGFEDRIVAKHDYDLALSNSIPAAGSELGYDLEVLIKSDPTHLFFQRTTAELPSIIRNAAQERDWIIFERPLNTLDDIASTSDDLYYLLQGVPQRGDLEFDMESVFDQQLPSIALGNAWTDLGPIADAAGTVLVLGSLDPIGAMGPGSYHHQLIERLGAQPAIAEGAMWVELDYEDLINLNPDSIILIAPRSSNGQSDLFGEPAKPTTDEILARFGPIADLPVAAIQEKRIGIIDHPLGLLPSGALGDVADDMRQLFEEWSE